MIKRIEKTINPPGIANKNLRFSAVELGKWEGKLENEGGNHPKHKT
jgi:hypothetical protein